MHSCCAPCAGEIMEAVAASGIDTTIYFYNPNIHPREEYEIRKEEKLDLQRSLVLILSMPIMIKIIGLRELKGEDEPERGERCTVCFDMRFERSALYAKENGFDVFATTLGISRWKDLNQINNSGLRAANRYNNHILDFNWRKQGGSSRMLEISKQEKFYKQEYCGCV